MREAWMAVKVIEIARSPAARAGRGRFLHRSASRARISSGSEATSAAWGEEQRAVAWFAFADIAEFEQPRRAVRHTEIVRAAISTAMICRRRG